MSNKYITIKMIFGSTVVEISKSSVYRLLAGGLTGTESADYLVSLDEDAMVDGGYVTQKLIPMFLGESFSDVT